MFLYTVYCFSGEDIKTILTHVNDKVGQKEASSQPGEAKQMPEVRFTLRKRLVFSPLKWSLITNHMFKLRVYNSLRGTVFLKEYILF